MQRCKDCHESQGFRSPLGIVIDVKVPTQSRCLFVIFFMIQETQSPDAVAFDEARPTPV